MFLQLVKTKKANKNIALEILFILVSLMKNIRYHFTAKLLL
ncbi:hypothetical protein BbuMM1_RS280 (plasmid) [Borreliella burgdorferi]|nr:hypothetical protein BbuMM1_RS280 [Borreliella burgdorferi]